MCEKNEHCNDFFLKKLNCFIAFFCYTKYDSATVTLFVLNALYSVIVL